MSAAVAQISPPRVVTSPSAPTRGRLRPVVRLAGGALVLAVLVWKFGDRPILDAWRLATWLDVIVAMGLIGGTTVLSAARWRCIASGLGVPLGRRRALAAYYRSCFLNVVLPGGLVGDAHRAVCHGRAAGDVSRGVRAAAWDRFFGKAVQLGLLLAALVLVRTPLRTVAVLIVLATLVGCLLLWAVLRRILRVLATTLTNDARLLVRPATLATVTVTSVASTLGHLAVYAVAVHAVGVHASWATLLPVGLVVMIGSSLPLSVGGWGMREGVTVWAFSMVGLAPAAGLTVSILCGALGMMGALPGAVLIGLQALRLRRPGSFVGERGQGDEGGGMHAASTVG